jgi:hypothetical protein
MVFVMVSGLAIGQIPRVRTTVKFTGVRNVSLKQVDRITNNGTTESTDIFPLHYEYS